MLDQLIIRHYQQRDKENALNLLRINTPKYFAPEEEAGYLSYLEDEKNTQYYFVLEIAHQIVGCGGFNLEENGSVAAINWGFLHPDFQGKGLGDLLLRYRLDKMKEISGLKKITLRTSQLVSKFYEKAGFEQVEHIKDYFSPGIDLVLMEKANN